MEGRSSFATEVLFRWCSVLLGEYMTVCCSSMGKTAKMHPQFAPTCPDIIGSTAWVAQKSVVSRHGLLAEEDDDCGELPG